MAASGVKSETGGTSATANDSSWTPVKNPEDYFTKAEDFKMKGNQCYKNKEYKSAIGKYHRGLLYLKGIESNKDLQLLQQNMGFLEQSQTGRQQSEMSEELKKRVKSVEADLYNNLAACLLQVPDPNYEKILHYCNCVLSQKPDNVKALYRRGIVLYHINAYEDSKESLLKAKSHCKGNIDPNIKKYLQLCDSAITKRQQAEKARYQGMFEKFAEEKQDS
ncbi:tetratricopeptide repeat protein 9C-like [Glandiceps talaboti]